MSPDAEATATATIVAPAHLCADADGANPCQTLDKRIMLSHGRKPAEH